MRQPFKSMRCWSLVVSFVGMSASITLADDFVPPQAEREAVTKLARQGNRIQVDSGYRVNVALLGPDSTNEDLKLLAACDKLTQVQINGRTITDEGLEHLKGLNSLTLLTITQSQIKAETIESLRTALPNCRITTVRSGFGFPATNNPAETRTVPDRGERTDRSDRVDRGDRGPRPDSVTFNNRGDRSSFPTVGTASSNRLLALANTAVIQDDMKLSSEQRQQIAQLSEPATINRLLEERINEALTPDQRARLKQLELQQAGIAALLRDDISAELKITDIQRADLRKVSEDTTVNLRTANSDLRGIRGTSEEVAAKLRERLQEALQQRETNMLAVLTEEQRQGWQALVGPKGPVQVPTPNIPTAPPAGANFTSIADLGRSLFTRYDADQDGQLTDAEFPESNRTRQAMSRAGITLAFPIKRDDFEKTYTKYVESLRARQQP